MRRPRRSERSFDHHSGYIRRGVFRSTSLPLHAAEPYQLLDVVYHAVELSSGINLATTPQREPVQWLVVPQVGEHRLNDGQAPAVASAPRLTVDRALHPVGCRFHVGVLAVKERDLPATVALGLAQARSLRLPSWTCESGPTSGHAQPFAGGHPVRKDPPSAP